MLLVRVIVHKDNIGVMARDGPARGSAECRGAVGGDHADGEAALRHLRKDKGAVRGAVYGAFSMAEAPGGAQGQGCGRNRGESVGIHNHAGDLGKAVHGKGDIRLLAVGGQGDRGGSAGVTAVVPRRDGVGAEGQVEAAGKTAVRAGLGLPADAGPGDGYPERGRGWRVRPGRAVRVQR